MDANILQVLVTMESNGAYKYYSQGALSILVSVIKILVRVENYGAYIILFTGCLF